MYSSPSVLCRKISVNKPNLLFILFGSVSIKTLELSIPITSPLSSIPIYKLPPLLFAKAQIVLRDSSFQVCLNSTV